MATMLRPGPRVGAGWPRRELGITPMVLRPAGHAGGAAVAVGEGLVDSGRGRRRGLGHQDFSVCRAVRRVGVVVVPMVARRRAGDDMGHMSRLVRGQALGLVAAGLLFTAGLGGCTSGETPTSPSSAPSSTAVAPTTTAIPTTSAMTDDEAAMEAVRRFYREFDAALKSRNTDLLRASFVAACRICREDAATIDAARSSGRTFEGGGSVLTSLAVTGAPDASRRLVRAQLTSSEIRAKDVSGKVVETSPGGQQERDYSVIKVGEKWLVESIAG